VALPLWAPLPPVGIVEIIAQISGSSSRADELSQRVSLEMEKEEQPRRKTVQSGPQKSAQRRFFSFSQKELGVSACFMPTQDSLQTEMD